MRHNHVMSGTGQATLFIQTRSPKTDFEAQFCVDCGFLKKTGFKNIQPRAMTMGIREYQPIQTRDQKARIKIGNTEYRVHTLHGLA